MRQLRPYALLALGALLLFLSRITSPVFVLAWVAPVPWLLALRSRGGLRFRGLFVLISAVAWTAAMAKVVTEPVPLAIALGFGVPFGVVHGLPFLLWDGLRARGREGLAIAAFGAAVAVADWGLAALTPLGVWSAVANTQVDNLPFLQVTSLAGTPGVAFLLAALAAAVESAMWQGGSGRSLRLLGGVSLVVATAHVWGAIRLAMPIEGPTVRAAAVGTDATFGGFPLPGPEERARIDDALFARTAEAARAGAQIVVWNEAATFVERGEQAAFEERLRDAARTGRVELFAGFIVPLSMEPVRYENEYVWVSADGEIVERYFKHHPVPGEPAVPGEEPLSARDTAFGRVAGAICYDYDFPAIGIAHGRLGADVVALPSSDWRGIDPIHTQMAAVRAIEGGFSIVRSTRMGLSAGIDAHGRARGWLSANESPERLLLVTLPARRVPTLYTVLGDLVAVPFAAVLAFAVGALLRDAAARERRSSPDGLFAR